MDDRIREVVRVTRAEFESTVDVDSEWAAFSERQSVSERSMADLGFGARNRAPAARRWMWAAVAAAAALVAVVAVGPRRNESVQTAQPSTTPEVASSSVAMIAPTTSPHVAPSSVATIGPTTAPPAAPTTSASPVTSVTATTAPTDRVPRPALVTYLSPPPELSLRMLGSADVPDPSVGSYSVAAGDLGVAVSAWDYSGSVARSVRVLGFDGRARSIDIPVDLGDVIAYGPGDVIYSSRQAAAIEDFTVVAVALSGERAGAAVASAPANINRFVEYPPSSFGHSDSAIVDRRAGAIDGGVIIDYVDVDGNEVTLDSSPSLFGFIAGDPGSGVSAIESSTGERWAFEIDSAPDRAGTYVGDSPPAAGPNGIGVYWTHIGPNAAPNTDFGEPSMWVIAELRPDRNASWWSIPDGWEVVASDIWGTVLARQTGTRLELALADFTGDGQPTPEKVAGRRKDRDRDDIRGRGLGSQGVHRRRHLGQPERLPLRQCRDRRRDLRGQRGADALARLHRQRGFGLGRHRARLHRLDQLEAQRSRTWEHLARRLHERRRHRWCHRQSSPHVPDQLLVLRRHDA